MLCLSCGQFLEPARGYSPLFRVLICACCTTSHHTSFGITSLTHCSVQRSCPLLCAPVEGVVDSNHLIVFPTILKRGVVRFVPRGATSMHAESFYSPSPFFRSCPHPDSIVSVKNGGYSRCSIIHDQSRLSYSKAMRRGGLLMLYCTCYCHGNQCGTYHTREKQPTYEYYAGENSASYVCEAVTSMVVGYS